MTLKNWECPNLLLIVKRKMTHAQPWRPTSLLPNQSPLRRTTLITGAHTMPLTPTACLNSDIEPHLDKPPTQRSPRDRYRTA